MHKRWCENKLGWMLWLKEREPCWLGWSEKRPEGLSWAWGGSWSRWRQAEEQTCEGSGGNECGVWRERCHYWGTTGNVPVSSLSGCHNRVPQIGGHLNNTHLFSPFWRLGVQDPGVGRTGFSWSLSPWLCRCLLLSRSSLGLLSVSICVLTPSSHKNTSQIGLESTLLTSF